MVTEFWSPYFIKTYKVALSNAMITDHVVLSDASPWHCRHCRPSSPQQSVIVSAVVNLTLTCEQDSKNASTPSLGSALDPNPLMRPSEQHYSDLILR